MPQAFSTKARGRAGAHQRPALALPSIRAGIFTCPALWRALVRLPCARLLICARLLGNAKVSG
jgi:hypothetical protein